MDTPLSCGPVETVIRLEPASRPGWATRLVRRWLAWQARMQQRRHLAALSTHMLKDIGITGAEVELELRKLPWQA